MRRAAQNLWRNVRRVILDVLADDYCEACGGRSEHHVTTSGPLPWIKVDHCIYPRGADRRLHPEIERAGVRA